MKTIRVNHKDFKIAAFKKWNVCYGKNNHNRYVIELLLFDFGFKIYNSNNKPLFRNLFVINVLWIPIWLVSVIIIAIAYYLSLVVDLFKPNWVEVEQRNFNIVNLIIILTLSILLYLK